ncbi:SRPBCC family protein [Streptomyces flavotricini]|uniref:SRPBCC family protein n=1 Tax=Streptomyces flavotricini TaxID=66888 RepID=A0ABS8EHF3_9ACTN|nr:SRPBCC family protein [Streptomyces flavotricini]MCC0100442.1 SRPBCC family protein [Streptomyces flavotricini]
MIQVARTMLIPCPMHDAVVYLADFAHTQEWDPATVSCVPLTPGALGPGSRWRNVSRFRGRTREVLYQLDVEETDRLVFTGENSTVLITDDLRFTPVSDESTRLTYSATFHFKGIARLAAPFLRKDVNRLADDVASALPRVMAR